MTALTTIADVSTQLTVRAPATNPTATVTRAWSTGGGGASPPPASGDDGGWGAASSTPGYSVGIEADRLTVVRGGVVSFKAVNLQGFASSDPFRQMRFRWEFGDASAEFKALRRSQLAPWGDTANVAYQQYTAHPFATPGSYTVTVEAFDGTHYAYASIGVTVVEPEAVLAANSTWVVAPDGNFTGAPSVPANRQLTTTDLAAVMNTAGFDAHIILKRSDTPYTKMSGNQKGRLYISTWGDQTKFAIFECDFSTSQNTDYFWRPANSPYTDIVIGEGVWWRGGWDPVSQTGNYPIGAVFLRGGMACPISFHRNRFTGLAGGAGLYPANNSSGYSAYVADCDFLGWGNFGIFGGVGVWGGEIGCRIEQLPDANGGGTTNVRADRDIDVYNKHGPHRTGRHDKNQGGAFVSRQCEYFSNNGWGFLNVGVPQHQPCIRFNSDSNSSNPQGWHSRGVFDRLILEGGNYMIKGLDNGAEVGGYKGADWIIDKVVAIGSANTRMVMQFARGGTMRNLVYALTDSASIETPGRTRAFQIVGDNPGIDGTEKIALLDEVKAIPVHIYSCTILDWCNPSEHGFPNDQNEIVDIEQNPPTDVRVENIAVHRPNDAVAPLSLDATLARMMEPLYRGLKWTKRPAQLAAASPTNVYSTTTDSPTRNVSYASPGTVVPPGVASGTEVARIPDLAAATAHTIVSHSGTGFNIAANSKFAVSAAGIVTRSATGTLTAGTTEQIAIRTDYPDRPSEITVVSVRVKSGAAVQPQVCFVSPNASMIGVDDGAGTLHALDYIDGTKRLGVKVRGAFKPA